MKDQGYYWIKVKMFPMNVIGKYIVEDNGFLIHGINNIIPLNKTEVLSEIIYS